MPKFSAPPQIRCSRCSSLFGRKYEYDRHIADVHAPKYICRYCGKQISSRKDKRREHLRRKHKISWTGSSDPPEDLFLDQHYSRAPETSPISSPSDPDSSPLAPSSITSPSSFNQTLRMPDHSMQLDLLHNDDEQNWQALQHEILSAQNEIGGSTATMPGYMQDPSRYSFHGTMGNYDNQGMPGMQMTTFNISSVPRSGAFIPNLPSRSSATYHPSLAPAPEFQDYGTTTAEWFPSTSSTSGSWNSYPS